MSPLSQQMLDLAKSGHPRSQDLCRRAAEFDHACEGFYADPQTVNPKQFLGAWARARRLYSELSGESLI